MISAKKCAFIKSTLTGGRKEGSKKIMLYYREMSKRKDAGEIL